MSIIKAIGILLLIGIVIFIIGLSGLGWHKFFAPKHENIRREVFEQTKSYVHGGIQDIAKYFEEYQQAETEIDKETIKAVVSARFAEFDASNISSPKLKGFLISMRGY